MAKVVACGVDEAGRGPLAGPVYAAAVILDPARQIRGLADSKVLKAQRREVLAERIKERASAWAVSSASVEEIDRLNIFQASMLAMRRAVEALGVRPEEAWIDGNQCPRELPCPAKAFVDGDARMKPISAASILAKTARDAEMRSLHERYPAYGFDQHKGYATADHLDALGRTGPCEIHRRSFYPIGVFYEKDLFSDAWVNLPEQIRIRSYRLYCEAVKLCAERKPDLFDAERRRLKREYADVLATEHAERAMLMLRKARQQLSN
ncbi:MAG: ribonuclease [Betaproteobacteria bacterium]|nr:ribonuclease [Betaproteobacteria bacterium]